MESQNQKKFGKLAEVRDTVSDIGLYVSYAFIAATLVSLGMLMCGTKKFVILHYSLVTVGFYSVIMFLLWGVDVIIKNKMFKILKQKEDI